MLCYNILSIIIILVCLNESRILFYYFNIDIVLSFVANHIKINNFNKCFVRFKSYIISYFMKNNRNFIGVSIIEERKKKKNLVNREFVAWKLILHVSRFFCKHFWRRGNRIVCRLDAVDLKKTFSRRKGYQLH